jgi:hypothetical protein
MLFFEVAVISFIIALIRGGRVSRLFEIQVGGFTLVLVIVLLTAASAGSRQYLDENVWQRIGGILHILIQIAFLAFFAINLVLPGMKWFLGGWVLNFIPIAANGGKMPVLIKAAQAAGIHEDTASPMMQHLWVNNVNDARFGWLSDIIPLPRPPLITPQVGSIGDMLMVIGIFWLIQGAMCERNWEAHGSDIQPKS